MAQGGYNFPSGSRIESAAPVPSNATLWEVLENRARWRDLSALSIVPIGLLLLYVLPPSVKWSLVLDYDQPTLLAAYTSHFVHVSPLHLVVNLTGFVLIVSLVYVLSITAGRRLQFFAVFGIFHLAFPFALSGMILLWEVPGVGLGYSGIVLAFIGYLPLALLGFVGTRFGLPIGQEQSMWLFFICVAIATFISLPITYGIPLAIVAALATVAFFVRTKLIMTQDYLSRAKYILELPGYLELVLLGVIVLVGYPFVAFSSNLAVDGGILNVYTHGVGLSLGYLVTYVGVSTGTLDFTGSSDRTRA